MISKLNGQFPKFIIIQHRTKKNYIFKFNIDRKNNKFQIVIFFLITRSLTLKAGLSTNRQMSKLANHCVCVHDKNMHGRF